MIQFNNILLCIAIISIGLQGANNRKSEFSKVLNTYKYLNNQFLINISEHNRDTLESFFYNKVEPILDSLTCILCEEDDGELLSSYINVLISCKNSANEEFIIVLGRVYHCNSMIVSKVIDMKKNNEDKKLLISHLKFGISNMYANEEISNEEYDRLSFKIQKMTNSCESKRKP